ncbi:MAG: hypothetical protein IPG09_09030 [Ignavibacteria bacterium]|nr:hypothetical protein [Ignavibacteria bacterium]
MKKHSRRNFKDGNEIKHLLHEKCFQDVNWQFQNKKLHDTLKSFISPEEYKDFVKSLSRITILSFVTARRALGRDYFELLQKSFDKDFVYKLCYDMPLAKINIIVSVAGWEKFLRTDFTQRLRISFVDEISTFLRNIALHGTPENYIEKLTNKLYEEQITDLLVEKLLDENIEDVFNFFGILKHWMSNCLTYILMITIQKRN